MTASKQSQDGTAAHHQEFFYYTFDTGKFHAGFLMTASKQSQDGTAAHHQEFFFTVHSALVSFMQVL